MSRRSYTAAFKLKVISVAEQKGKHHAAKLFGVHRKRVQDWCKSKEHLKSTKKTEKRKPGAGRPIKYTDIENTLLMSVGRRVCALRVRHSNMKP